MQRPWPAREEEAPPAGKEAPPVGEEAPPAAYDDDAPRIRALLSEIERLRKENDDLRADSLRARL